MGLNNNKEVSLTPAVFIYSICFSISSMCSLSKCPMPSTSGFVYLGRSAKAARHISCGKKSVIK